MSKEPIEIPMVVEVQLPESSVPPLVFHRIIGIGESVRFRMGSRGRDSNEEPAHKVMLTEPFWMAETPVTQAQFEVWTESLDYRNWYEENKELTNLFDSEPHLHRNDFPNQPSHPADAVCWYEASAFCAWLSECNKVNRKSDSIMPSDIRIIFDLPTEAQWEYACRCGTDTDYWSGDGEAALGEVGFYNGNSKQTTHRVGTRPTNGFGLYDMHGNVAEWCRDGCDEHAYRKREEITLDPFVDPSSTSRDGQRVMRGGSRFGPPTLSHSACRTFMGGSIRGGNFGFRVCLYYGAAGVREG